MDKYGKRFTMRLIITLMMVFMLVCPPAYLFALAPSSDAEKIGRGLGKRGRTVNTMINSIKGTMRGRIHSGQLETIEKLAYILEPENIENAVLRNPPMWMDDWVGIIDEIGIDNIRETIEWLDPYIDSMTFSETFNESPVNTMKVIRVFAKDRGRSEWILKRYGGIAFAEKMRENLTGVKSALEGLCDPSFPQEIIGLWVGPGRLFTFDDIISLSARNSDFVNKIAVFNKDDIENLLEVFPLETYKRSMSNNPYEFVAFLQNLPLIGTNDFLDLMRKEIKLSKEFENGFIKRFEAGANTFLLNYTGLHFWQIARLYKEWKEDRYGPKMDYYRRILHPQSGVRNWDQLRDELNNVYGIPFKSVPCRIQVVTPEIFDSAKMPSIKRLILSVVFDPVELDNLERKGIKLSQPELGSVQMVMKGKTLIMTEIQNYWVARNERNIPPHLIRKYHSWPVIAMLALEDYARRHGFTEIIIPNKDYIYRRYGIVTGLKEKKEFYRELDWLYEKLPQALGYDYKKIPNEALDDGLIELLLNGFHRKDLTEPQLAVVDTYRSLLNPDRFFNTLRDIAQKNESKRRPSIPELMDVVNSISDTIASEEDAGVSPAKLRKKIRTVWAESGFSPQTLHWNYSFDDPRGRRFYGISLGEHDFVFEADLKKHKVVSTVNQRYPVLIAYEAIKPLSTREAERLKSGNRGLDHVLLEWQIGKISPHIPLLMKWGKEFGRDKMHRQFIAREYIEALEKLFSYLPRDVSPLMLDEILKSFDKKIKGVRDSNKVEMLRVSGPLIRNILDQSRDIEWVKKQIDTLLAVELDMLRSTLPVAAKALNSLPNYEGSIEKYLDGAQRILDLYGKNKGMLREGLVFYTVGCLAGAREKPRLPDELIRLYSKLPAKTSLSVKEDILEHLLALKDKGDLAREAILKLCAVAVKERDPDADDINRVLGSIIIIRQELDSSSYRQFVEKLMALKKLRSAVNLCNKRLAMIKSGDVMQASYPKADLLQDLMDGIRRSPMIKLGGVPMRLQVNLDNAFDHRVAEISLYPIDKAKKADPALELLDFGFAGEFKEAPRGAIGKIHIALAEVDGKTALVVLQRQASQGHWRLISGVSGTSKRNAYRNWNRELLNRIVNVAGQNRKIDKVICLSEKEVGRLVGGRISEDVINEFYSRRSYMRERGFAEESLPEGKPLSFAQKVAFGTGKFKGPFFVLDLKPESVKIAKKADDEKKGYLDLYTQREMNPVIREAFENTGRYLSFADGEIKDESVYGIFKGGRLVDKDNDRDKWDRMRIFASLARHLIQNDESYPFKRDLHSARIVAVEGLPYDGHYGTGGPVRNIPSVYIPWDVFEYLYERWDKGDPDAVYELGDLIFHEITEPALTKKIVDEEDISQAEARNLAHWQSVDKEGMLTDELRLKLAGARVKLIEEMILRQKVAKAETFGERLRLVREARAIKTGKEFASLLGTTPEEVSRWENDNNLPVPKYVDRINAILNFSPDLILYGKPMYFMIRDPMMAPVDRLNIVRMINGISWKEIGKPKGKRIAEKKIAEYANKLNIDMNLVVSGKSINEILDEISTTVPWRQRFWRILSHMLLAKGMTMDDVARKSGMNAEALRNYIRGKGKQNPKASYIPRIARALGIPEDILLLGRSMNEELGDVQTLGSRLRKARLAKGLDIHSLRREAKLARKVDYNKIENDRPVERPFSEAEMTRIAAVLEVDPGLLFFGEGKAPVSKIDILDSSARGDLEFEPAS